MQFPPLFCAPPVARTTWSSRGLIAACGYLLTLTSAPAQPVHRVTSTDEARWQVGADLAMTAVAADAKPAIEVFAEQARQTIDGFGGCFNELGWEALLSLPAAEREKVLRQLFSAEGANFGLCRTPIGSSDYAFSYYSYDDVPEDFAMENFNVDRDRYVLLRFIKAAKEIRPDLRLWASPWCPPAWMKINQHYALNVGPAGSLSTTMPPGKRIANNATAFRMQHEYLEAYALYFSKYVQAYRREGVEISRVCVQNEIAYTPFWPSCTWRPEDLAFFIGKYLGPRFAQDQLTTEIWLGTVNWPDAGYVRTVMKDPAAQGVIKGIGLQWAAKKAVEAIHTEYPSLPLMQTESECGNGEKNWKSAEYTWSLMHRYLSNGASAYMYWNMVLESSGRSAWGWKQNMLVAVDQKSGEVAYTPEFYLMMHLSHFVLPGARRVQTSGAGDHLAFVNPDGTRVLVLANTTDAAKTVAVAAAGRQFEVPLPAHSFSTLTWSPQPTR